MDVASRSAEKRVHGKIVDIREGRQNVNDKESLHSIAKAFGIDISEFGDQAESLWNKLNHLHDSNPDSYRSFIQSQLKGGMEVFTPEKGFVVKVLVSLSKLDKNVGHLENKLFINFCQHKAIDLPLNPMGGRVNDNTNDFRTLEIPLVVSSLRKFDHASENNDYTVDVVLNPWCFTKSSSNNIFKAQIIQLGIKSIQEECKVKVQSKWKVIKSVYKGGIGILKSDVHPFFVDIPVKENEEQDLPIMSDPCTLLRSLESKHEDVALNLNINRPNDSLKSPKSVLIEDITSNEMLSKSLLIKETATVETHSTLKQDNAIDATCETLTEGYANNKKTSKARLTVQMKGFLNRGESRKPIYDVPSSGDGQKGTGGDYASFMARCKVVDTATLPSTKDGVQIDKQNLFDDLKNDGLLYNKKGLGCKDKKNREIGNFDAEFEHIVDKIDPKMSDTSCDDSYARTDIEEALSAISNVMKGSEVSEEIVAPKIQLDPTSGPQHEDTTQREHSGRGITGRLQRDIPYKLCPSGDFYTLSLDLSTFEVNGLTGIDLETSGNTLTVSTCCGGYLKYYHPQVSDNITAKLNRKRKRLKIIF